jgi:hypothetical protein
MMVSRSSRTGTDEKRSDRLLCLLHLLQLLLLLLLHLPLLLFTSVAPWTTTPHTLTMVRACLPVGWG